MTDPSENGTRFVSWQAFGERQDAIRRDHEAVLESLRHDHTVAMQHLTDDHKRTIITLDARLDVLESVIDQQRGARQLVYFLIGSNVLMAAAIVIGWVGP